MRFFIVPLILLCLLAGGCSYTETRKVWSGLNADDVNYASRAYAQTFSATADELYCRVLEELQVMNASIFKRDDRQRFVVVYGFNAQYPGCLDTTEVGIIVRDSPTPGTSEVIVASDNPILGARVARDLFKGLAGLKGAATEEAKPEAKPEPKPEVKPEPKPEPKPEDKPEARPEAAEEKK